MRQTFLTCPRESFHFSIPGGRDCSGALNCCCPLPTAPPASKTSTALHETLPITTSRHLLLKPLRRHLLLLDKASTTTAAALGGLLLRHEASSLVSHLVDSEVPRQQYGPVRHLTISFAITLKLTTH